MCFDGSAFAEAVDMAREIFDIGTREGFEMNLLDIGGGFPGYNSQSVTMEKVVHIKSLKSMNININKFIFKYINK